MMLATLMAGALSLSQPTPEPCYIKGNSRAVECVTYQVPADYQSTADNNQYYFDLEVILVKSLTTTNKPPLVVFAGGPGQAATELTHTLKGSFKEVKKQHDIIFVAQRGSGLSNAQSCAENKPTDLAEVEAAFNECRKKIARLTSQLTTETLVQDIEFVRKQLGYDKLNLWGGSYGTFAAQHYAAKFSQHVNTMILDAAVSLDGNPLVDGGPYAQQALDRLNEACQADALCHQRFPNWQEQLGQLLEIVEQKHVFIQFDGKKQRLGATDLAHIVRTVLYVPSMAAKLPFAIEQARNGNTQVLSALNQMVAGAATDSMYLGLTLGVLCQEHVHQGQGQLAKSLGKGSFVADSYYQFWLTACGKEADKQADYIQVPEQLDIPTLLISGMLDPVTPEQSAEKAMRYLTRAQHIVIPYAGHTNSGRGCMPRLLSEFLSNNKVADDSCITNNKFPLFMQ